MPPSWPGPVSAVWGNPGDATSPWRPVLQSRRYDRPVRVSADRWMLPPGAFRHTAGPT